MRNLRILVKFQGKIILHEGFILSLPLIAGLLLIHLTTIIDHLLQNYIMA